MRFVLKLFVSAITAVFFASCLFLGPTIKGNGKVVETVREVGDFNSVRVTSGMNVYLEKGDSAKVVVIADENLHETIETKVVDGTLEISAKANIWSATSKKVVITVPAQNLREILGTAGSNIYTNGQLVVDEIDIKASAGSNFDVDLNGQNIEVAVSSGANVNMTGKAKNLIVRTSSGANLKAEKFEAEVSQLKVSSGANIWVTTLKELTAHASSGGNIFCYGKPIVKNTTATSGGNIITKD